MDFVLFQLLFAALVLALLFVVALTVRSALRNRAGKMEGAAPSARTFSVATELPEPDLQKTERRRQIGPASAVPAFAAGEAATAAALPDGDLIEAGAPEPGPASDPTEADQPEEARESGQDPETQDPDADEDPAPMPLSPFHGEVMDRLEAAFERYSAGAITLEDYVGIIAAERQAVERRIEELSARECATGDERIALEEEIDDARCAQDAIHWCLDWAEGLPQDSTPA
jgi:hypothetical protein